MSTDWTLRIQNEVKVNAEPRSLNLKLGDYDTALTHYQKSMEIKEKIGNIAGTPPGFSINQKKNSQVKRNDPGRE